MSGQTRSTQPYNPERQAAEILLSIQELSIRLTDDQVTAFDRYQTDMAITQDRPLLLVDAPLPVDFMASHPREARSLIQNTETMSPELRRAVRSDHVMGVLKKATSKNYGHSDSLVAEARRTRRSIIELLLIKGTSRP